MASSKGINNLTYYKNYKFKNYTKKQNKILHSDRENNLIRNNENEKSILVFTGEGSKILDKNSIYLKDELSIFKDMNFYEENNISITQSGFNFNKSDTVENSLFKRYFFNTLIL